MNSPKPSALTSTFLRLWDHWCDFFFGPQSSLPMGVFRFTFALNALAMYSVRMLDWKFYFTDEGFVPGENAIDVLPEFIRPYFSWYPTTDLMVVILHGLFLIALVALMLGYRGRIAAIVSLVLHLAFMQRNFSIVYGADIISSFLFFSLALSDNSRAFSLDAWAGRSEKSVSSLNQMLSTMGLRLLQIQVCVIYGYTGLEKLKGPSWWDGTAVWSVLGNHQILMFDMSFLKHIPVVIALMTFSTVLFEVYFPILVWMKGTRKWVLLFGVLLHIMIAFSVGLIFFSLMMVSTYFVYLESDSLRAWLQRRGVSERWLGLIEE